MSGHDHSHEAHDDYQACIKVGVIFILVTITLFAIALWQ